MDLLVLKRSPQTLDEDIVHAPALAVHADRDLGVKQHGGERFAGELCPLVCVEDLGPAGLLVRGF